MRIIKHLLKYVCASMVALVGIVGFSACSSNDEAIDNPDYNPRTNTVKTEFTISVPNNGQGTVTRMLSDDVQANGNFLGIRHFRLFSFTTDQNQIGAAAGNSIALPGISAEGFTTSLKAETNGTQNKAKLYTEIEIQTGTRSFLLYGEAWNSSDDKAVTGSIEEPSTWIVAPDAYTFNLTKIIDASEVVNGGSSIIEYLTGIANAPGWAGCADSELSALYVKFTSMKTGSSNAVKSAVLDLYHTLFPKADAVSESVKMQIRNPQFAVDESNNGSLVFTEIMDGNTSSSFPRYLGLPNGAAVLEWYINEAGQKVPALVTGVPGDGKGNIGTIGSVTPVENYVFPASLYYRTKSNLKAADFFEAANYVATNNWEDILSLYDSGDVVTASTRSVAIENPIQYAVGRLDVKVKTEDVMLYDHKGSPISIGEQGLLLTGVLVGGQSAVDYQFEPLGGTKKTIYDRVYDGTFVNTVLPSDPLNHTLVFETPTEGEDQKIKIALEFTNNTGEDIEGIDGIISPGCSFYLLAELDPTGMERQKVFEQDYITVVELTIGRGTDVDGNSVGLGGAYNTIPDLRNKGMELGLAVNLEWKSGLTFRVDI